MTSIRKDDHIRLALQQSEENPASDFDRIRFVHRSIPVNKDEISLHTTIAGLELNFPFYINAMTGGSETAKKINAQLAQVAKATGLAMATGSLSAALKDPTLEESYRIVRDTFEDGIIFANIGADRTLDDARRAVDILNANALQIHLNAPQEIVMPEGDREFHVWEKNISDIVKNVGVEVVVKEVGFGMSRQTVNHLIGLGVKTVDVSGRGGTNFIRIENARRPIALEYLDEWGLSTVESLIDCYALSDKVNVIASGGIRHPLDMAKAFALGAKAIGLSGTILSLVQSGGVKYAISVIENWKEELRMIMLMLGVSHIEEFGFCDLILDRTLVSWCDQRRIPIQMFTLRNS
jgi:isopentenyl-diphosphate Delta-isomerase